MEQNEQQTSELALVEVAPPPLKLTPQAIEITKENITLCERLVSDVLERDIDWGLIPGVSQPNLWDSGAAKIMAAFTCYPKYAVLRGIEEDHLISFTMESSLVSRQTQHVLATGIGASSTRETKYKYRWVTRDEALAEGFSPEGLDTLKKKDGKYRIPNPEYGELVNTVAKMAAKRADVDAVHSLPGVAATLRKLFMGIPLKHNWKWFEAQLQTLGIDHAKARTLLGVKSIKADWLDKGKTLDEAYDAIKQALQQEKSSSRETTPPKGQETPKPKRDPSTIKSIEDLMKACHEDFGLGNIEVLREANARTVMDIVDPKEVYLAILAVRGENV